MVITTIIKSFFILLSISLFDNNTVFISQSKNDSDKLLFQKSNSFNQHKSNDYLQDNNPFQNSVIIDNVGKIILKYQKAISEDYRYRPNLSDQLSSFSLVYYKPYFSKPVISISRTYLTNYIYAEVYDSSIVILQKEQLRENFWNEYYSNWLGTPNKVIKNLSDFVVKDKIVIALYGDVNKDVMIFKRDGSLLYPIFIRPFIQLESGNYYADMKNLPADSLLFIDVWGDEYEYSQQKRIYLVNDTTFHLAKTIALEGDGSDNWHSEYKSTVHYDESGTAIKGSFHSEAKMRDGSPILRKLKSDKLTVYKIDPIENVLGNYMRMEPSVIEVPDSLVQIFGYANGNLNIIKINDEYYIFKDY